MAAASGNVYDGMWPARRLFSPSTTPCELRKQVSSGLGSRPFSRASALAASCPRTMACATSSGFVTIGGT